jgi:hypothetical protein
VKHLRCRHCGADLEEFGRGQARTHLIEWHAIACLRNDADRVLYFRITSEDQHAQ